jgi:hypothetical protein
MSRVIYLAPNVLYSGRGLKGPALKALSAGSVRLLLGWSFLASFGYFVKKGPYKLELSIQFETVLLHLIEGNQDSITLIVNRR